jgi:hypothetical protein
MHGTQHTQHAHKPTIGYSPADSLATQSEMPRTCWRLCVPHLNLSSCSKGTTASGTTAAAAALAAPTAAAPASGGRCGDRLPRATMLWYTKSAASQTTSALVYGACRTGGKHQGHVSNPMAVGSFVEMYSLFSRHLRIFQPTGSLPTGNRPRCVSTVLRRS